MPYHTGRGGGCCLSLHDQCRARAKRRRGHIAGRRAHGEAPARGEFCLQCGHASRSGGGDGLDVLILDRSSFERDPGEERLRHRAPAAAADLRAGRPVGLCFRLVMAGGLHQLRMGARLPAPRHSTSSKPLRPHPPRFNSPNPTVRRESRAPRREPSPTPPQKGMSSSPKSSTGGSLPPPPPPPPPPKSSGAPESRPLPLPRRTMFVATISVDVRLLLSLSSHWRY